MGDFKKYISLWTIDKDKYYIEMSDDDFYVMSRNNMMLLIEEREEVYLKIIELMLKNGVKVFTKDFKTGEQIFVSVNEAMEKLKEISTKKVKVKIIWKQGVPISKQILQLKKISKELTYIQTVQLFQRIDTQEKEWIFCETSLEEAEKMKNMAIKQGLQLEIEEVEK